jgi:thioredoxin-dependent peroxiredoxin
MPAAVAEGTLAPDFTLPDAEGHQVQLSSLRGQWVVVYFYPKDATPGCTAESCAFRDSHEDFVDAGAVVIGISGDSVESHKAFAAKHKLPFTLLADTGNTVRKAWAVPKSLGILAGRVTYVIDPTGTVRKVFSSQLRATAHIAESLSAIRDTPVADTPTADTP